MRRDPDGFLCQMFATSPDAVRPVADSVLIEANRLSDRPWEMRALMKKARLPRFGKALIA